MPWGTPPKREGPPVRRPPKAAPPPLGGAWGEGGGVAGEGHRVGAPLEQVGEEGT